MKIRNQRFKLSQEPSISANWNSSVYEIPRSYQSPRKLKLIGELGLLLEFLKIPEYLRISHVGRISFPMEKQWFATLDSILPILISLKYVVFNM